MKKLITVLTFLFISTLTFSQNGYCFSTSNRGDFEEVLVNDFDRIKTKSEQTNIFSFSFTDKMLVHLILRDDEVTCQYYQIVEVNEIQENSYFINCLSGLSGNNYFYYLTVIDGEYEFYQISDTNEDNEMSGTRFSGFGKITLNTFEQEKE